MTHNMKMINAKRSSCEEISFAGHAVWAQGAGKVVDYMRWSFGPSRIKHGEDVVPAFSPWDAMKTVANTVGTPHCHNAPCEALLAILAEVLRTFCATVSPGVLPHIVL